MTVDATEHFWMNTTVRVAVAGLKDTSGQYVNDATLVGTFTAKDGTVVDGVGDVNFAYTPSSNGNYDAFFVVPAGIKENSLYDLRVLAIADNRQFNFRVRRTAKMYAA